MINAEGSFPSLSSIFPGSGVPSGFFPAAVEVPVTAPVSSTLPVPSGPVT